MIELKTCPFCGGNAKVYKYAASDRSRWVGCSICGIGTSRMKEEAAIELWNKRVKNE